MLSEILRQGQSLLAFPWEILVCAMIVFTVKGRHILRRAKEETKRFSALVEDSWEVSEIRLIIQAHQGLMLLPVEASPLMSQTLSMIKQNKPEKVHLFP